MSSPACSNDVNRRSVLLRLGRWLAALFGVVLLHPLLRFSGFTIKPKPKYVSITAPLPRSGVHAEREFFLFAATDQSTAWAVSRTCTHLGCRINFLEDKQLIECPCHQSRFSLRGERLSGPAQRNLPVFPVEVQRNAVGKVTGYVVTL